MFTVEHERISFKTLKNLMSKSDVLAGHMGAEHFGAEHFGALKSMEYS
jgi:hypothetical protein